MSSLFTVAEVELARLGLAALPGDRPGRGGRRSRARLHRACGAGRPAGRSLIVVDALAAVIDWHQRHLLPVSPSWPEIRARGWPSATSSPWSARPARLRPRAPGAASTPSCSTSTTRRDTCCTRATRRSTRPAGWPDCETLHPGGVFALWSDDPPDPAFTAALEGVFTSVAAHVVDFHNPLSGVRQRTPSTPRSGVDEPLAFDDAARWEEWCASHHEEPGGAWLRVTKKGRAPPDAHLGRGRRRRHLLRLDRQRPPCDRRRSFAQRYSRRRARSPWSKVNVDRAAALIAAGRMRAPRPGRDRRGEGRRPLGRRLRVPGHRRRPARRRGRAGRRSARARACFDGSAGPSVTC